MSTSPYRVPRAILPAPQEMTLADDARLLALWERNAGDARQWFTDFESFKQRMEKNGKS